MSMSIGQLVVTLNGAIVTTVALNTPVLPIGRTPDNALPLPHPMVSRRHAELRLAPEGPVVTDVGSTHGTFVGGTRLLPQQPRVLAPGESFSIGPFTLTYQPARTQAAAEQPPDVEPDAAPEAAPVVAPPVPEVPVMAVAPPVPAALRPPRPTFPVLPMPLQPSGYLNHLPIIFQDNDFLARFLLIYETIWEPLEQRQTHLDMYFDPTTCPTGFLPWLASWVDLPYNRHWPEARIRRLLADAMDLYRWRGTRYGLARMLEIQTGLTPEIREDPAEPYVFSVRVTLPMGSEVTRALIEDVIQMHKPAHTGYVLEIQA